jgi:hypothetical protein
MAEADLKEHDPGQNRRQQQEAGGDQLRRPGADDAAEKTRDQRAGEREKDNCGVDHGWPSEFRAGDIGE